MTDTHEGCGKATHGRKALLCVWLGLALLSAGFGAGLPEEITEASPREIPCGARTEDRTAREASGETARLSYFTEMWELDKESRGRKHAITPYRPNYGLVFTYNAAPNLAPLLLVDPDKTLTKPEVTFQLSFKTKLWQDVLGQEVDLWFGYTQRSFWQLYNFNDSSPFRETNYEPEFLFNIRTRFRFLGFDLRFVTLGLNHQSNGQSEPLSRSWNRLVAHFGLEKGRLSLLLKAWYRIPEAAEDDDNPRMDKYLGHGELWAYYFVGRHRLAAMVRNNLDFGENRGAVQVEWSFPLFAQVAGHVQWYHGYGESLLDYDHRVNRLGFGFVLTDWR